MSTSLRNAVLFFVVLAALLSRSHTNSIQAQQPCRSFPETGRQVCGRLLEYWQQNGGIAVFGYPIGDQSTQAIAGRQIQVQLFERNRLELHNENAPPYDVLLGRLGADALQHADRDWRDFPRASASAPHYFPETGHAIAPEFWAYWSSHGLEFDANILNCQLRETGVGYVADAHDPLAYGAYWTQDFGTR